MSGVIDFDNFRAEQEPAANPVILRIGGVNEELPPALPASVAVEAIRLNALGPDADLPPEKLETLAVAIFGADLFDRLLTKYRLTLMELPQLISQAITAYTARLTPPPNRATRRASRRSRSGS